MALSWLPENLCGNRDELIYNLVQIHLKRPVVIRAIYVIPIIPSVCIEKHFGSDIPIPADCVFDGKKLVVPRDTAVIPDDNPFLPDIHFNGHVIAQTTVDCVAEIVFIRVLELLEKDCAILDAQLRKDICEDIGTPATTA